LPNRFSPITALTRIIHEASAAEDPSISALIAAWFFLPKGAFGLRQLAVAFKNNLIFEDFEKSARQLAHFESFAFKFYAALPVGTASLRTFMNNAGYSVRLVR